MHRQLVLIAFAAIAFAVQPFVPADAQERKAPFVDEGGNDPSFAAYRDALLGAIAARDVDAVVAAAAPDIQLDYGGGAGQDEFRHRLTVTAEDYADEYAFTADEDREGYWDSLEAVLRLGGVFNSPTEFVAPYTFSAELTDSDDAYTTGFIIGSGVPLRIRPSRFGDEIARLDEDIVLVLDGGVGTRFLEVRLADGRTGFVHEDDFRRLVDYRAFFEKRDGRWLMTTFIAGD